MSFWDWKSGHRYQSLDTTAQPGSLDAESGIFASTYDKTGLRLICGEADKTSMFSPFRFSRTPWLPISIYLLIPNPHSQNLETRRNGNARNPSLGMETYTRKTKVLIVWELLTELVICMCVYYERRKARSKFNCMEGRQGVSPLHFGPSKSLQAR